MVTKFITSAFPFSVGLEMEFEIGPNMADVKGWNYRYESMINIVNDSIKWQKDTLGFDTKPQDLEMFQHNIEIIREIREYELKDLQDDAVSKEFYLTRKNAKYDLWM